MSIDCFLVGVTSEFRFRQRALLKYSTKFCFVKGRDTKGKLHHSSRFFQVLQFLKQKYFKE